MVDHNVVAYLLNDDILNPLYLWLNIYIVFMWRNFYIRLDDDRNHHPQSSLSSSLRFNERVMMMKKRSSGGSCSNKRVKAYVQRHHRKKPVRIYIREKNAGGKRERERKNVYKHDRCVGGPAR